MKLPTTGPQFLLLDGPGNWQCDLAHSATLGERASDGALVLKPLPGRAALFWKTDPAALIEPAALALDAEGRLLVADAGANAIHRVTLPPPPTLEETPDTLLSAGTPPPEEPVLERLGAFGGAGAEPRQFRGPRGLAVFSRGSLAVADTGNGRVQIFSAAPSALLGVWTVENPRGLAAGACGTLFVADRGRVPCVRQFARDGVLQKTFGTPEAPPLLRRPVRVAVSPQGFLAVVDLDPQAACVVVYPLAGGEGAVLKKVERPRAVAFDSAGTLFVGDALGLVHRFEHNPKRPGQFRRRGAGDTGLDGEFTDLVWSAEHGLLAIIVERRCPKQARLYRIDPAGACVRDGEIVAGPLDSRVPAAAWHRVQLFAKLPEEAADARQNPFAIALHTFTAEQKSGVNPAALADDDWTPCFSSGRDDPDGLVRSRAGRYLWLKIRVRSDGSRSPVLTSAQAHFPRAGYLAHLPAIFQEDAGSRAFLERFLAIFQTGFDDFDRRIDELWSLFDPTTVPAAFFPWLAAWLDLPFEPKWNEAQRRAVLKNAHAEYARRGTVEGLRKAIEDYAGVAGAQILEHFRLRRWPMLHTPAEAAAHKYWPSRAADAALDRGTPLFGRGFFGRMQLGEYSQLGAARLASRPEPEAEPFAWGAHKFTVFFPADPYRVAKMRERVERIVNREKPAHTAADFRPVFSRMRVGVQARIGFDAMIGGISHLVLGQVATLGCNTILSMSAEEKQLRSLGAAITPRLGVQTKLL